MTATVKTVPAIPTRSGYLGRVDSAAVPGNRVDGVLSCFGSTFDDPSLHQVSSWYAA